MSDICMPPKHQNGSYNITFSNGNEPKKPSKKDLEIGKKRRKIEDLHYEKESKALTDYLEIEV
jgi:hypothetical protein